MNLNKMALVFVFFQLSGCMSMITLFNHDREDPYIYSGTRGNIRNISEKQDEGYLPMKWVGIIDFPFSLVMDTILLPVTAPLAYFRRSNTHFDGHGKSVYSARFLPDGKVVSVDGDGKLKIWSPESGLVRTFSVPNIMFTSLAATETGYGAGSSNNSAFVWFDKTGNKTVVTSSRPVVVGDKSGSSVFLALHGNPGLWSEGSFVAFEKYPGTWVSELATDGRDIFVAGMGNGFVVIWNKEGEITGSFQAYDEAVRAIAVGPGGIIVTGSQAGDKAARIWSKSGELLAELKGHKGDVYAVDISIDGKYIVTGSEDETVRIWTIDGQLAGGPYSGHGDIISSVNFSYDSLKIVSSSRDRTVRIIDITAKELAVLAGK